MKNKRSDSNQISAIIFSIWRLLFIFILQLALDLNFISPISSELSAAVWNGKDGKLVNNGAPSYRRDRWVRTRVRIIVLSLYLLLLTSLEFITSCLISRSVSIRLSAETFRTPTYKTDTRNGESNYTPTRELIPSRGSLWTREGGRYWACAWSRTDDEKKLIWKVKGREMSI